MTALLAIISIILIAIVAVQIGKVTELAAKIRGEEEIQNQANRRQARYLLLFMVAFLVATIVSGIYYRDYFLGFGPQESASAHGKSLDQLFKVTLFFTGIVFFITQILLFWYAYKYRGRAGGKAMFVSHNNRLEIIWTLIPAIVMTFLVVSGLDVWNEVMADVNPDEEFIEIEATGYQFAWALRYPGPDGKLGAKDFRQITALNPLGQDWEDRKNLDDTHPSEIVLPVGKKVRVRITSRDVLHNFYLPHFRVKMDAVPGMPTYFVFTPTTTTEEYRQRLSTQSEWQQPLDPDDPEGPMKWEAFNFELACAELCGKGHWSMKRIVRIVSEEEYEQWLSQQSSYYATSIRGTEEDPWTDRLFDFEIEERKEAFDSQLQEAFAANDGDGGNVIDLENIQFETGEASLTSKSTYEIQALAEVLRKYPELRLEIAGHTDDTGSEETNLELSRNRAQAVLNELVSNGVDGDRLISKGYGATQPIGDNSTEEGRAENRRTEFRLLNKIALNEEGDESVNRQES